MNSEEIIYQKVYVSPRPPPTISFKDNWMKEFDSEVAGSSKDIQRIELKPGELLQNGVKKPWNVPSLIVTLLIKRKHDNVQDPTSAKRPVCGHESAERRVLKPKHVEERWIKRRNTTWISEFQDCHTQLSRNQNISEFKSL